MFCLSAGLRLRYILCEPVLAGKWLRGGWIRWCLKIITSISICTQISLFISQYQALVISGSNYSLWVPPSSNVFHFRAEPRCILLCSGVSLWNMGTSWCKRCALFCHITQRTFLITCRSFGDNLSVPSSWTTLPLKMGPVGCPERPARNYHYALSNIPEERRSHLRRGWSLTSGQLEQASETVSPTY